VIELSYGRIAATGKDSTWGLVLYLLAHRVRAQRVLELGACAGLSAMYIASVRSVESIVTVEGSDSLARLSAETLAAFNNATVEHRTFDEYLAQARSLGSASFDVVFIDGHHEKTATLRYLEAALPLMSPNALVVFDDISWSEDMRAAWDHIRRQTMFDYAVDLGVLGICRLRTDQERFLRSPPKQWDLRFVTGVTTIGQPWGWKVGT
jgi:predicted O-methyltransferase YrrM